MFTPAVVSDYFFTLYSVHLSYELVRWMGNETIIFRIYVFVYNTCSNIFVIFASARSARQLRILEAETDGFGHCLVVVVSEHAHLERLAITCDWTQLKKVYVLLGEHRIAYCKPVQEQWQLIWHQRVWRKLLFHRKEVDLNSASQWCMEFESNRLDRRHQHINNCWTGGAVVNWSLNKLKVSTNLVKCCKQLLGAMKQKFHSWTRQPFQHID